MNRDQEEIPSQVKSTGQLFGIKETELGHEEGNQGNSKPKHNTCH